MNKWAVWVVLAAFLMGCKTAQPAVSPQQSPAPTQPVIAQGEPSSSNQTKPQPQEPLKPNTPAAKPAQANNHATEPQTSTPKQAQQTALPQVEKEVAPATPKQEPAPKILPKDTPVFEEEELIDTTGRLLNPYAYLQPDASARTGAPWDGEQLKYGIYYTFIKAGTAYIRNRGVVDIEGKKAFLIQTTAFSAAVIDAFFKVRDINQSWIDAQTFYSLGYGQSVREGSYKRDEWVNFAPQENRYYGQIQKKDPAPREIKGELATPVADFLSSLYFVRAQKLEVGKDIVFDIVNREKQYPLIVKVLRKEKVKTPAGEFNCIVVEPQLRGEGIFVSKGKSLTVWLTDDQYRMPVKMKTEVFIGSVSASLLEYKRL